MPVNSSLSPSYVTYDAARIVQQLTGWPFDEALRVVSDVSDMVDEGLTTTEIAKEVISEVQVNG